MSKLISRRKRKHAGMAWRRMFFILIDVKFTRGKRNHAGMSWRRLISSLLSGVGTMLGWPGGKGVLNF